MSHTVTGPVSTVTVTSPVTVTAGKGSRFDLRGGPAGGLRVVVQGRHSMGEFKMQVGTPHTQVEICWLTSRMFARKLINQEAHVAKHAGSLHVMTRYYLDGLVFYELDKASYQLELARRRRALRRRSSKLVRLLRSHHSGALLNASFQTARTRDKKIRCEGISLGIWKWVQTICRSYPPTYLHKYRSCCLCFQPCRKRTFVPS